MYMNGGSNLPNWNVEKKQLLSTSNFEVLRRTGTTGLKPQDRIHVIPTSG